MPHATRWTRRALAGGVLALLLATTGCSAASDAIADKAIDLAEGRWTCTSQGDGDVVELDVDGDGRFEVVARSDEDDGDEERAAGAWTVVDQDIQVSIAGTVARVLGGDGLGVDAGTITLEVPSMDRGAKDGETERLAFDVAVTGRSKVVITPTDHAAERYPSGAITCVRP